MPFPFQVLKFDCPYPSSSIITYFLTMTYLSQSSQFLNSSSQALSIDSNISDFTGNNPFQNHPTD